MGKENELLSISGIKFWVIAASIVVVVMGIREASVLVLPLLLAIFVSAICLSPFLWLKKKGIPQVLALLIIILGIAAITFVLGALLGTSASEFSNKIPFYEQRLSQYWSDTFLWLVQMGWVDANFEIKEKFDPSSIMSIAGGVFTGFSNMLSNSVLILIMVIFMLLEVSTFTKKMKIINPVSVARMDKIVLNLNKYFGTKTLTSFSTGITIAIALAIVGVDFPLMWGMLAFLLNFIPNIGSIIAAIPAVLLALIQLGPSSALVTAVIYVVVNGIIGNVIEPKVMGKNLGLSPLIVFVSLIFWGWVLGTVGMLLATPLTMTIKIVLDSLDNTRNIGIMIGDESSLKELM